MTYQDKKLDARERMLAGEYREERAAMCIKHTWCYRNRRSLQGMCGRYVFQNSQLTVYVHTDTYDGYDWPRDDGLEFVRAYADLSSMTIWREDLDTRADVLDALDKILGDIDRADFLSGITFVDPPGDATRVDTKIEYNNRALEFDRIRREREEGGVC